MKTLLIVAILGLGLSAAFVRGQDRAEAIEVEKVLVLQGALDAEYVVPRDAIVRVVVPYSRNAGISASASEGLKLIRQSWVKKQVEGLRMICSEIHFEYRFADDVEAGSETVNVKTKDAAGRPTTIAYAIRLAD